MRRYVATTKNDCVVSVETDSSHASTHLTEQPGLWGLTRDILAGSIVVVTPEQDQRFETDMGRYVGRMDLVGVVPGEKIIWAKRLHRETFTPFVMRPERPETSFVSMILKHLNLDAHIRTLHVNSDLLDPELLRFPPSAQHLDLFTAYIGRLTPSLPGDRYATAESLPFWLRNALVWGSQAVDETTITYECPWPLGSTS